MPPPQPRRSQRPRLTDGDDPRVVAELLDRAEAGAERELRQLERNLRLHLDIVRHMQLGLLVWRRDDGARTDFRLVTANPAAGAIAGSHGEPRRHRDHGGRTEIGGPGSC